MNVSLASNVENATTDNVLRTAFDTPEDFELRAPIGSFTAAIDSNGANGVFRFNSTSLNCTVDNVKLFKCFAANGSSMAFGSYAPVPDPDTEGTWWLEDDSNNYIPLGTDLTSGTNYWVNYVVKDNGKYDSDRALGFIEDPVALGVQSGGSTGCVMNPHAGFGVEWFLLGLWVLLGFLRKSKR